MADLSALIDRVEALTGPDLETDFAIYCALRPELRDWQDTSKTSVDDYWFWMSQREYTASLDAAVALVERVLPGQEWSVGSKNAIGAAWGKVRTAPLTSIEESVPTPAIALILATLRALQAKGGA